MITHKEIDREALISKLYTSKITLQDFSEDMRTASNGVELAFKLGEWKSNMLVTLESLIKEVEHLE